MIAITQFNVHFYGKIIIGINDVLQIVSCNDVGTLYTQNKL